MTIEEFNSKYIYTSDEAKYGFSDIWEVMEADDGVFEGDCESYCLTLKAKVEGFQNLELYYCHYNGEGHCIGNLNGLWIDCGLQRLVKELPPQYTNIKKYWKIEIVTKKLLGKVLRWLKN